MKFMFSALMTSWFVGLALGQGIVIGAPADGSSVSAGSNFVVELDKPGAQSPSIEVAVVIGIAACTPACRPPSDIIGTILYNGPYNPVPAQNFPFIPSYQNFNLTIPAAFPTGSAQLNVFHTALVGAGPEPFTETLSISLIVQ